MRIVTLQAVMGDCRTIQQKNCRMNYEFYASKKIMGGNLLMYVVHQHTINRCAQQGSSIQHRVVFQSTAADCGSTPGDAADKSTDRDADILD